jgi:hypothetical protein
MCAEFKAYPNNAMDPLIDNVSEMTILSEQVDGYRVKINEFVDTFLDAEPGPSLLGWCLEK